MINLSELLDRAKKKALEKPDNKDGYAPKSTDELRFKRKHASVTTPDANKNGDDVFKGTNVKAVDRQPHYGYNPGQDEEVYEEAEKPDRLAAIAAAAKKKNAQIGKTVVTGSKGGVGGAETRRYPAGTLKNSHEQVDEVLKPSMGAGAYVSDFVHSKNPKFAGKSKKERMKQALAAFYSAKKGD